MDNIIDLEHKRIQRNLSLYDSYEEFVLCKANQELQKEVEALRLALNKAVKKPFLFRLVRAILVVLGDT